MDGKRGGLCSLSSHAVNVSLLPSSVSACSTDVCVHEASVHTDALAKASMQLQLVGLRDILSSVFNSVCCCRLLFKEVFIEFSEITEISRCACFPEKIT